jgi:hypothetical protein
VNVRAWRLDANRVTQVSVGIRWHRLPPGWLFVLELPFFNIMLDTGADQ